MKAQQDMKSTDTSKENTDEAESNEVVSRPTRRVFTAEYKRNILEEVDACEHGHLGLLMRREGLYSSHLETWRRQRDAGELAGLTPRKRGRKAQERNPLQSEIDRLRREAERLRERLRQAEIIISVQKKVSEVLGLTPTEENH
jgi:transposase